MIFYLQDLLFGSGIITVIVVAAFYYFKELITLTIPLKVSKDKEYLAVASFFVICAVLLVLSITCLNTFSFGFNHLSEDMLMLLLLSIWIFGIILLLLELYFFEEKKLNLIIWIIWIIWGFATLLFLTLFLLLLQYSYQHFYWFIDTTAVTISFLFASLTLFAFYFGRVYNTPPFDVILHLENDEKLDGKIIKTHDKFVEICKYLFSWSDVPGNNTEFIKFLKDVLKIEEVENTDIKKSDNNETITVTDKNNNANLITIKLNKAEKKINLEIAEGKTYKYILKEEDGKINIYDNTRHLVNLDKIKEIEIPPHNQTEKINWLKKIINCLKN